MPPMPDLQTHPQDHLNWHAHYDRPTTIESMGWSPPWSCQACDEHANALRMMARDREERAAIWDEGFDAASNNMYAINPYRRQK